MIRNKVIPAGLARRSGFLILLWLSAGIMVSAVAQKQAYTWYFGRNAGLDFSDFDPVALLDGQTNADGGVASICDSTGQLLFYTDGRNIWNAAHNRVNGSSLSGDPESTQSATIVPDPTTENQYFVFTARRFQTGSSDNWAGNYYTIRINPGGAGEIIYDYSAATGRKGILENATEKFLAIPYRNADGNLAYWFLMHEFNSNRFVKVRLDGGWGEPVFQSVGSVHANDTIDDGTNRGAIGQMKANDTGTRIALAVMAGKFFEVFAFNSATGNITLIATLPAGDQSGMSNYKYEAYGVEFSPTGSFAYQDEPTWGNYLYGSTRDGAYLYQWNLAETNSLNMIKSGKVLFNQPEIEGGALQIAPNGKIYMAFKDQNYLGVINYPNRPRPFCRFEEYGACLSDNETGQGGLSGYGLPATLPILKVREGFSFENTCYGDETTLYVQTQTGLSAGAGVVVFTITKVGGGVPPKSYSLGPGVFEVKHKFPVPGDYTVVMMARRIGVATPERYTRIITIHPKPVVQLYEKDTVNLCHGSYIHLDAGNHAFYEWEDPVIKVRERDITTSITDPFDYAREFRVRVTENNGCVGWDTIWVKKMRLPTIASRSSVRAFCDQKDGSATVIPNGNLANFEFFWDGYPDEHSNTLDSINGGDYVVHVVSKVNGCSVTDTIHVEELGGASVKLNYSKQTICPGVPTTFTVTGSTTFEWIRPLGLSGDSVTLTLYQDTIFEIKTISIDEGRTCERTLIDTIRVHPVRKPEIVGDTIGCAGDTLRLVAPEGYESYLWSNEFEGRINPVTTDQNPLILFATDSNRCTFTDDVSVRFKPRPAVNLGQDRAECSRDPVKLSGGTGELYLWGDGETSREINASRNGIYKLTITTDGCSASDSVNLRINNPDHLKIDSVKIRDISCFGQTDGEIRIVASGDGLNYQYSIDEGVNYKDTSLFRNLGKGVNYRIVVWEDSACRISYPQPVSIVEPGLIEAKSCINPPSCPDCRDGSITLSNITGGTAPFKFWLGADLTDADMQGLGPGTYQVSITDANNCSWSKTVQMDAGTNVHIVATETKPVCPGVPVTLTVVNGAQVDWIFPATGQGNSVEVRPFRTTTYQAMSTSTDPDGFQCTIIAEHTVEVIPYNKPDIGDQLYACEGDTVELDAGPGYLNYSWNLNATTQKLLLTSSKDLIIVFVTDVNRCTLSDTASLKFNPYPKVDLGEDLTVCTNDPIELTGGSGDSYRWFNDLESQSVSVTASGVYWLDITKDHCTSRDSVKVTIVNPDLLQISRVLTRDNTCFESNDGTIEVVGSGSGGEYLYSIDGQSTWQSSALFGNLPAGADYQVWIMEDSICKKPFEENVIIRQPDPIVPIYRLRSPTCIGCTDGQIVIKDITGGNSPYRILLKEEEQQWTITGLPEGDYSLLIRDSKQCEMRLDLTIDMNNVVPNVITPNGDGINDYWRIPLLDYNPEGEVTLFSQEGILIRRITFNDGYNKTPWDGTDESGTVVPMGTYYYILKYLDERDGWVQLTGYVMVLK